MTWRVKRFFNKGDFVSQILSTCVALSRGQVSPLSTQQSSKGRDRKGGMQQVREHLLLGERRRWHWHSELATPPCGGRPWTDGVRHRVQPFSPPGPPTPLLAPSRACMRQVRGVRCVVVAVRVCLTTGGFDQPTDARAASLSRCQGLLDDASAPRLLLLCCLTVFSQKFLSAYVLF